MAFEHGQSSDIDVKTGTGSYVKPDKSEEEDIIIQVKASQSQNDHEILKNDPRENDENEDENEHQVEHEQDQQTQGIDSGEHADLVDIGWGEFERRYTEDLRQASDHEDVLRRAFDDYADSLDIWAQTGSLKDDDRAHKRLKTRTRFIKLSEQELKDKQDHYTNVVDAFKKALTLLQGPSAAR